MIDKRKLCYNCQYYPHCKFYRDMIVYANEYRFISNANSVAEICKEFKEMKL